MDAASRMATWIAFRSVVRRSVLSQPSTSPWTRAHPPASTVCSRIPRAPFTTTGADRVELHRHQNKTHDANSHSNSVRAASKPPKRKAARAKASSSSLRRVAVEAQRSRSGNSSGGGDGGGRLIIGKGRTRHVDPDADTKELIAYCAAETYDVHAARTALAQHGWAADPMRTELFPQVLHVQLRPEEAHGAGEGVAEKGVGDVFVFPSGCLVAWNVAEVVARRLVESVLLPAAGGSHAALIEEENMDYIEDPTEDSSTVVGDTIILGTKVDERATIGPMHDGSGSGASITEPAEQSHEVDAILGKIAFSSAVARSTKLAVLEERLAQYFDTTRGIPATLSAGAQLKFTRAFILRKTGELLGLRAQLNLYSELTDALPDLFWDSPHELGLEGYYEMVGRALDVGVRIKVLNERMDYASEIAAVLRERLSEKHSTGLEWMIIGLITIEVGFGVLHLWRESKESAGRARTEDLLQEYLERELGRRAVEA